MATQTVCDQCGKVLGPHFSSYQVIWSNSPGTARDYCSPRCAVRSLGGDWAEGTSRVIEDDAIADDEADRFLDAMQGVRTIPWPPSEELVERVAGALSVYWGFSGRDAWRVYAEEARAVLDAIGGAGDE